MIRKGEESQVLRGLSETAKVAVIDCGLGNLFSIQCALQKTGLETVISSTPESLRSTDAIVLPGVGNFKAGSDNLHLLKPQILSLVEEGRPLFGICLGMQLFFEKSEESQGKGLSVLQGDVVRLPLHIKTPHMGWNTIAVVKPNAISEGIDEKDFFYFVHSYYAVPRDKEVVTGITDYGLDFASVITRGNIYGTQFHPEKSGKPGEVVLKNFSKIVKK